jgi:integrase
LPAVHRFKTKYPGVYFIEGKAARSGRAERIYYIMYRKEGKLVEEKAGRQFQDDMTPARAAAMRTQRLEGKQLSNKERREVEKAKRQGQAGRWTIDRLWEAYKSVRIRGKGLKTDEGRYKNYIQPLFGNKEPNEILALEVDRLRVNLLKKRSPQTVKHVLDLIGRIVNFGFKRHLCQSLPFPIQRPKVNNKRTEDLRPDQLDKLVRAINADGNIQAANLMKMALFTGMRRGELFKLKWEDIDFHRGFISIRDPKGGLDQKIPLNEGSKSVLETHPRTDSPYVFPGRAGGQRVDINHQVNRIKNRAGLPKDFRPLHGLRHTYASMLASSGEVDMYTLQKLLTHKDPRMTQRYAHLRDESLIRAAKIAADIINKTATERNKTKGFELREHQEDHDHKAEGKPKNGR